jgi:peptidyl-prolyl cis-trans isomerase C
VRIPTLIRLGLASLFALSLAACGAAVGDPTAAATVNGKDIALDEIARRFESVKRDPQLATELAQDRDGSFKARVQARILTQMIQAELLSQAAGDLGIAITDADIAAERERIVEQVGGQEQFDTIVRENKLTEADVEGQLRDLVVEQRVAAVVAEQVEVTDADVRAYYEENKNTRYERMRASHILLETEDEAQAVLARVRGGEDFAALATQLSKDTGSATQGGDLGEFTRGRLVPEFEQAAFGAEVGEIVGPIETEFGWHVIKVTAHTVSTFEDVADEVRAELTEQRRTEAQTAFRREHFADADVRVNPRLGRWNAELGEVDAGDPLGPAQAVEPALSAPGAGAAPAPEAAADGHTDHEH